MQHKPSSFVYLDDVLNTSISRAEHMSHLWTLFERLSQHKLVINPAKCQFGLSIIDFLGHCITKESKKGCQTYVVLYEALKTKALKHAMDWSAERDMAFRSMKNALVNATMLAHLSPNTPIAINTDASDYELAQYTSSG